MGDGVEACVQGSGGFVAVLYLDLIAIELPRIVCALKGSIRSISSFFNSAVDLALGRDEDVLDRNEGGPAAEEIASFFTLLAGLSFAGGAIDRRCRGSASRLSLSISTAFFCCLCLLVNCEFVSLCLRALVMDTNDCFMDIEDLISDFILPVVFSWLFSFPGTTLDFVISPAFLVSGGLPKAGVADCLEGGRLDLCLLVAPTGMSERDNRLLSSPLPSTRTFDAAFKDLERFFAGFIADGGLQVGGTFRLHSREVTVKEDRFRHFVEADDIGCFRVSSFLGGN
jgi:hypothetical protein